MSSNAPLSKTRFCAWFIWLFSVFDNVEQSCSIIILYPDSASDKSSGVQNSAAISWHNGSDAEYKAVPLFALIDEPDNESTESKAESEFNDQVKDCDTSKLDELKLNKVMTIEGSDGKIAQTIKDTTASKNQQILTMDSMQSVTSKDVSAGATYLGIMKDNLSVLSQAIN